MSDLTPVKRALLEIRELRAELEQARAATRGPIAIVGMGLRLPGGVDDPAGFARLLWSGTDAVTTIPAERWSLDALHADDPDAPGKMTTRHGAFLQDVDRFDAEFFGISPREAATMDPQQRILLEVAWHALEDAGHPPAAAVGTRLGVYLGIANCDYGRALYAHPEAIDAYFATGTAFSVAAGRLSYFLGAQGPAVSVDTACSSSLVALHLACQALRLGECDRALAGGINLILTPEMNINFSKARMMAADGRCKTFDAAADGYVRGEGCGLLVLRRLDDALAAGDRVLAVIRGSALNQDGRSGGLTAPNGPSQEAVIRAALEAGGVPARAVGYVEAHGTGTSLGDPIEMGALGAVLGAGRDRPLYVGSIKTNMGHLEAAAGVAGIAKAVLALQRKEIPPHLHFQKGNPHIDWSSWPVAVPTAVTPFAPIDGRRIAGVSSFGFSGTNAHAVLEEAPEALAPPAAAVRPRLVLPLSARDDGALADQVRAWHEALSGAERPLDLCHTAAAGRSHHAVRLAVTGEDAAALRRSLEGWLEGSPGPEVAVGRAVGGARPQVAFLFTGQGAQIAGMGRGLYEAEPVFRRTLDRCAEVLRPILPQGLLEVMFGDPATSQVNETRFAQPANFALEVALAALWRSWGVEPVAVLGHSLGEFAAACVAGVLELEDGLRLVAERGRVSGALPHGGAMAAIFAPEEAVAAAMAGRPGVSIAAYNGPAHHVVSGPRAEVEAVVAAAAAKGVETKLLHVPHAAHSALVEPALPALRRALEQVRFGSPRLALVSNVTGAVAGPDELARVDYWLTHLRQPVRFAQSMQAAAALGITHFVEIGPHPVLTGMGAECLPGDGRAWLPSLRRGQPDEAVLLEALCQLYAAGAEIDWAAFGREHGGRRVAAPRYPFRRRRHWSELLDGAARPAQGPDAAARFGRVTAALERQAERAPLDVDVASYPAKWEVLSRLTRAHAAAVLRAKGIFSRAGERRTLDEVLAAAGIAATYRHLVGRWLDGLAAAGALGREGDAWVAAAPLADPGLPALWGEAERRLADNAPLLAYVRRCGALVEAVITGRESPLETLFPGGSFDLADGLYQRSATMRYVNELAAAAVEAFAAGAPGRPLRVLEVGAGTGGTTAALLPPLSRAGARYTFTDVSEVFLDRARERFGALGVDRFGLLDLDAEPETQGFEPGSFDLVVASNCVHAAKDLRRSLDRLLRLLAPGGALLLVESTTHHDWFDMTTGLVEGWQTFADDLRGENPLLPAEAWVGALRAAGFADAGAWPREGSIAGALGLHVVVARAPGEAGVAAAGAERAAEARTEERAGVARPPDAGDELARQVRAALPAERIELLREYVRDRVVRVLRLDAAQPPDRNARLMDLGFDSLMAVQLRNQLTAGLKLPAPLPATVLFDYPTIERLAGRLGDLLAPAEAPAPAAAAPGVLVGKAAVEAMSDAEVEALLLERLGGKR